MRPLVMMLRLLPFSAMLLSGCTQPPHVSPQIPESLLICPDKPDLNPTTATQKTVAAYIVDLSAGFDACKANLASVGDLLRKEEQIH